eukprot:294703-Prorocentrum_lima.AAC.1
MACGTEEPSSLEPTCFGCEKFGSMKCESCRVVPGEVKMVLTLLMRRWRFHRRLWCSLMLFHIQ